MKKDFKIYAGEHTNNSLEFKKFLRDIEKSINEDSEIIESAKKINREFTQKAAKILADPGNEEYAAGMIEKIKREVPRYSYKKNVEYNGKKYDVEIDQLLRVFYLVEI